VRYSHLDRQCVLQKKIAGLAGVLVFPLQRPVPRSGLRFVEARRELWLSAKERLLWARAVPLSVQKGGMVAHLARTRPALERRFLGYVDLSRCERHFEGGSPPTR
jgi:hypothetical protein